MADATWTDPEGNDSNETDSNGVEANGVGSNGTDARRVGSARGDAARGDSTRAGSTTGDSARAGSVLAVVPARGGSTRIPRKNLERVGGTPLVGRAVEQAAAATELDETVVSTDDADVATAAEAHGGDVPFERPASLATDRATSADVLLHALDWFAERGRRFDVVVMLLPTAPFRAPEDVDGAVRRLFETGADSVATVSEYDTPPHWAVELGGDGRLRQHFDGGYLWTDGDGSPPRSQDLPRVYAPNGAVFAARTEAFRAAEGFYTDDTAGYVMPRERAIDVDEPADLRVARALADARAEADASD